MGNSKNDKDRLTLEAIGRIYCTAHHDAEKDHCCLCPECRDTVEFTLKRAKDCPNGHTGNCQDCEIRCQRGERQQRIRTMMAYSAPRMVYQHPLLTIEYARKKLAGRR